MINKENIRSKVGWSALDGMDFGVSVEAVICNGVLQGLQSATSLLILSNYGRMY